MSSDGKTKAGLSWLAEEAKKQIDEVPEGAQLPTGGGDFVAGITGLWKIERMISFLGAPGIDIREKPFNYAPDIVRKMGQQANAKHRFYWSLKHRTEAELVAKELKPPFAGEQMVLMCDTSTVLGWSNNPEKGPASWGNPLIESVDVSGPFAKSGKALQYVLLPSLVQSVAEYMGLIDGMVYPYESLKDTNTELLDWQFYEMMWGPLKSREYPAASILGQARAQLWAKLGESNAMAYMRGGDAKFACTSKQLVEIIGILYRGMAEEPVSMWLRMVRVPDLNPDAAKETTAEDGTVKTRHYTIPMIAEVFGSEQEAREGIGDVEDGDKPITVHSNGDGPDLPATWKQYGADTWIESVRDFMIEKKIKADMPEGLRKRTIETNAAWIKTNLNVDTKPVMDWVEYLLK